MTVEEKKRAVDLDYKKYVNIAELSLEKGKYERCLAAISAASQMLYNWNQTYTDDLLESLLQKAANSTKSTKYHMKGEDEESILFYDCFGLDVRGLALIYLKALGAIGKKIVYVVPESAQNKQTEIDKVCDEAGIQKVYYHAITPLNKLKELQRIVSEISPKTAFLYTTPSDTSGIVAFMQMENICRFQINLTDHAFWLGVNAFDFCLEFRNYGSSISYFERKVPKDKLILLPYYPAINRDIEYQGMPEICQGKKILFSGGSLYKTINDKGTYYKMVGDILKRCKDTVFLYAGSGDTSFLNRLILEFPDRACLIDERKDLFKLMENITVYLNTYPISGGLMMQYAAIAGKIPVSLMYGEENSGILLNQKECQIEYCTPDELVDDVCKLLNDAEYRCKREMLLTGSVIDENIFRVQLKKAIIEHSTDYNVDCHKIDTTDIRNDYMYRFDVEQFRTKLARRSLISLFPENRLYYLKRFGGGITKIIKKVILR